MASSSHVGSTRGGHASRRGLYHLSFRASVPSPSNLETFGTNKALALDNVFNRPEETPSITFSDSLGLGRSSSIALHTIYPPLLGKVENRSLASPKPKLLTLTPDKKQTSETILISSKQTLAQVYGPNSVDRYLEMVDKVVKKISYVVNTEEDMEDHSLDDLGTFHDLDDDMLLSHYQTDGKMKALAC